MRYVNSRILLVSMTVLMVAVLQALLGCSCGEATVAEEERPVQKEGAKMPLKLTSPAFKEGEPIPKKYTGEGLDLSPPLQWIEAPGSAKSFALICDDPDAPMGTWVHWVIYNIPAEAKGLPEAVPVKEELPDGTRQGKNDFRKIGYGGPMPPPGKIHHYYFNLYALDTIVDLPKPGTKADLLKAMRGHIVGEAKLVGTYKR